MQKRKRSDIYGVVAGIFLTILGVLIIWKIVSPSNTSLYMIPISIGMIVTWVYAYRISRHEPS